MLTSNIPALFILIFLSSASVLASVENQILVSVEGYEITAHDLERVLVSSPLAESFPVLDEKEQASIRGNLLIRLINQKLFYLEAKSLKLDQQPSYIGELDRFNKSIVYKQFMDQLRDQIKVPEVVIKDLIQRMQGKTEALQAALAQYKSSRYQDEKQKELVRIKQRLGLQIFRKKISKRITQNEVIAQTDEGYQLKFSDLNLNENELSEFYLPDIERKLIDRLELDLVFRIAVDRTESISPMVHAFEQNRLPAMLLEQMKKQWIPDVNSAKEFIKKHPDVAYQPERRLISQIVLDTQNQAQVVFDLLNSGGNFYKLARQYSIDPAAKRNAGQMGWVLENSAGPEIEAVLKNLPVGSYSNVIETAKGYHIIYLQDIKSGIHRPYEEIKDRVDQTMIQNKMPDYLSSLRKKYRVKFSEAVQETRVFVQ